MTHVYLSFHQVLHVGLLSNLEEPQESGLRPVPRGRLLLPDILELFQYSIPRKVWRDVDETRHT